MQLHIYNTLTRQKELFVPLMEDPNYKGPKKDFVGLYSCGPTVYREPHIGNMRAYICRDILRSTLENVMGYKVTSVINMTDVGHLTSDADEGEDKMEKGAKREAMTVRELADKYIASFKRNFQMLNISEYKIVCRATENIPEQIEMIQILEKKGYVYIIPDDGLYMDTSKVADYGYLARLDIDGLQQGTRIENDNKKNKTDFALWKFSPVGEKRQMERDSPRGTGFPGRHIECSAMASKYLGHQFDIHTGGVDHLCVHHPDEIAQSEAAWDVHPRVKYWMHNQFLNLGGKKVSKSEGGLISVDDIVAKGFAALDFRYLCLTGHYRNFLDFSEELLQTAQSSRNNLIKKTQIGTYHIENAQTEGSFLGVGKDLITEKGKNFYTAVLGAICDDLNTPKLLAVINTGLVDMNEEMMFILYRLEKNLLKIGLFDRIGQEVATIEIPDDVKQLADQRLESKQAKDYARADELRKQISDKGREVKDTKEGYELAKM